MKKFYETPAVEITGFEVEDIITTSGEINPEAVADSLNSKFAAEVEAAMAIANSNANTGAAKYGTYNW